MCDYDFEAFSGPVKLHFLHLFCVQFLPFFQLSALRKNQKIKIPHFKDRWCIKSCHKSKIGPFGPFSQEEIDFSAKNWPIFLNYRISYTFFIREWSIRKWGYREAEKLRSGGLKRSKPKKVTRYKFHKFWKPNFQKCAVWASEE